jgi:hypothetical protein
MLSSLSLLLSPAMKTRRMTHLKLILNLLYSTITGTYYIHTYHPKLTTILNNCMLALCYRILISTYSNNQEVCFLLSFTTTAATRYESDEFTMEQPTGRSNAASAVGR